ncbi:endothelin-converting enzyme 2-like [Stegodyphus dumicola]|uniref:endothelin-converting enzyme 2-like n=1 Tax=Stegodyphus dumicola TaxID=202533 RepID=UPI0015B31834|nr:endothelin-converting enzyme 2-like [Stegodyphus dumicola]
MHNNKGGDEEKTEPKENDKWMENNEHDKDSELNPKQSRLDDLRGRAKKFASNKYHVIIVLLCIILFILFLIVIILSVQLGTYKCPEKNECRTFECLNTAAAVVSRSDALVDPCDDFWDYSCNGWMARNPLPKNRGSYSVSDQLKEEIYSRVRHIIDLVPHDSDPTSHQFKVKNFYTSCRNLKDIEYWVPEKIKQAIHEIGGWAVINDSPGGHWSRQDVLKKLHVTFGVSAFFKLLVEADDIDPVRNIIKLVPGGLGLPSPKYYFKPHDDMFVRAYKDFIKNTIQEMGVALHDANRFAEEIFHYEKRLAEVTPDPEVLRNTKDLYVTLTVNELDRLSTSILWTDLLQSYFPGVVGPETEVAVLSENYFRDVSRIISSTDNSVLNNYYMWRLMHTFVPHSSSKFRLVANHFKQTFEGVTDLNLEYQDNWEFCIDVTSQFLGHAIGAMYVEHYFPRSSHEEVQVYLHKLVGAFNILASDIPWLEESSHGAAQSKIRSLLLLSGHPGFVRNNTLATYYKELRVQVDYFQNLKDGVYFLHKKQEEMLKKNAVHDYSWTIYSHGTEVDYKYAGNQLVVPAGLFEDPLFDFSAPLSVKYGVLAAHIANKLAEVFDDKGINYDMYGTLKPWIGNNSAVAFKNKKDCLKKTIANYTLHDIQTEPELTVGSVIADIGGVKIAYEAYKKHIKEEKEEDVLPGTDISNDQLFFISYAQSLCQIIKAEKLKSTKECSTRLPEELRVLSTLQQLPEFSRAFSCSKASVMNSRQSCNIW